LTNANYSLARACKQFCDLELDKSVEHGIITPDYIEYGRRDVKATVVLAGALLKIFDMDRVSRAAGGALSETKTYSPASLAKAYLSSAGFKRPTVPDDRLGPCFAAFYGGWTEVAIRGRVPVTLLDFKKMYQTSFILQDAQSLLASTKLEFVEDTGAVRQLLGEITLADLYNKSTWRQLNALCWAIPDGAIFETTAKFGLQRMFTSGMVPRHSDKSVCYYLADVVLAKLLSGRVPKIDKAERICGRGKRRLQKARMPGNASFDPATDNFFKFNVEHGEMMKQGIGPYAHLPLDIRDALVPGIKCIGNSGAYGIYAETIEQDLPGNETEPVELWSDGASLPIRLLHPENPGEFCCPPLAGLITAGARLMLGMAHREVMNINGSVAFGDTDSLAIVATEHGGSVQVATSANYQMTHSALHSVSHSEIDAIIGKFAALNPYDPAMIPGSILEIKFRQAEALCISSKRYCLINPNGSLADRKESVLGMLLSPLEAAPGDDRQDASHSWIDDAWRVVVHLCETSRLPEGSWLGLPAVRRIGNSTPGIDRQILRALNRDLAGHALEASERCRPFNFLITATAVCDRTKETRAVLAPFERDPSKWLALEWIDAETGERLLLDVPGEDRRAWRLRTVGEFLQRYASHYSPEWLDRMGAPCGPHTRGVTQRMPIRDGERWLRMKESLTWGDDPRHFFATPEPVAFRIDAGDPWPATVAAIHAIGITTVAGYLKVDPKTAARWVAAKRPPPDASKLASAIITLAHRADLVMHSEEAFTAESLLSLIPQRVEFVRISAWYFASELIRIYDGIRALARAMAVTEKSAGDFEPTIRRWIHYSKLPRDLGMLEAIIERVARFCRAEALAKGRPRSPNLGTPGENRRVVLWYLLFVEDPSVPDRMVYPGGDNLRIAVGRVGIEPDEAFYESLNDGEPRAWPPQLLAATVTGG
jgi:hypothetical protein